VFSQRPRKREINFGSEIKAKDLDEKVSAKKMGDRLFFLGVKMRNKGKPD